MKVFKIREATFLCREKVVTPDKGFGPVADFVDDCSTREELNAQPFYVQYIHDVQFGM
jgi:hypothetical protein